MGKDLAPAAADTSLHPPADWGGIHDLNGRRERRLVRLLPAIPGLWHCFASSDCVCNQLVALSNRVLAKTPEPSALSVAKLRSVLSRLFGLQSVKPWSYERVLESFKDHRRKIYERAYHEIRTLGLTRHDYKLQAFVKSEKFNPEEKVNPDARVIQARSPKANLALARFLRPMERRIYSLKDQFGLPIFAKTLGAFDRASVIRHKFSFMGPGTVCFSLDGSRWDMHIKEVILREEHRVYQAMCKDHELRSILREQLFNEGKTRLGIRYSLRGGRMSGDINTALGNCVLMVGMITAAMETMVGSDAWYTIFDDGDDCLLFLRSEDVDKVREMISGVFLGFGQELKLENEAHDPCEVVFCQSKMIETINGWQMVRNWKKVVSHGTSGVKHWNNIKLVKPMMSAVGSCELALNLGVPIIQSYALALKRIGNGERLKWLDVDTGLRIRLKQTLHYNDADIDQVYDVKSAEVTLAARHSFERVWGVPVWEQLTIESYLDRWQPNLSYHIVGPERNQAWEESLATGTHLPEVW